MPILSLPNGSTEENDEAIILITKAVKFDEKLARRKAAELAAILVDYLPGAIFDDMIDFLDQWQREVYVTNPTAYFQSLLSEEE